MARGCFGNLWWPDSTDETIIRKCHPANGRTEKRGTKRSKGCGQFGGGREAFGGNGGGSVAVGVAAVTALVMTEAVLGVAEATGIWAITTLSSHAGPMRGGSCGGTSSGPYGGGSQTTKPRRLWRLQQRRVSYCRKQRSAVGRAEGPGGCGSRWFGNSARLRGGRAWLPPRRGTDQRLPTGGRRPRWSLRSERPAAAGLDNTHVEGQKPRGLCL